MKRKIKVITISILGTIGLLFVVLVIHIATAKPVVYDNATMQISRIDFKKPLDSAQMKQIHKNLKTIPGFINDSYNLELGVLVYFHDNKIADSKKIYYELMKKGNYQAKRFILPKELASQKVCPVMNQNSLSYKFSKEVQRIFN